MWPNSKKKQTQFKKKKQAEKLKTFFQGRHKNGQQVHEKCSTWVFMKMQIKTTRHHLIPVRMAVIKKTKDCKCQWGSGEKNSFKKKGFYLFLEGKEGRKRNFNVWLPLKCPLLGTCPTTQACALTGNWTGNPLLCNQVLNPPSHTSQDKKREFLCTVGENVNWCSDYGKQY